MKTHTPLPENAKEITSIIQQLLSGIFPPVQLSSVEVKLFSIQINPRAEDQEELDRYVAEDVLSVSYHIRCALMIYRESFIPPADHAKDNLACYSRKWTGPIFETNSQGSKFIEWRIESWDCHAGSSRRSLSWPQSGEWNKEYRLRGLEVNPNVLHRWRREFRQGPGNAFAVTENSAGPRAGGNWNGFPQLCTI